MSLIFKRCSYRYGRNAPVLDGLDLQVDAGATVLLGPNGAGKSTLMGIGASWLDPASGSVSWRGISPARRRHRRQYRSSVGWLPQNVSSVPGLTVREQAAYQGWLKGMSRSEAWDASAEALRRVRLYELADRKSHQISGGQLRRLGIAGSLTHRSEILMLDEPTAGLDPTQRQVFRELMSELVSDVQIIVSTHQTEDLDEIYDEVVVLEAGSVCYQGGVGHFLDLADKGIEPSRRAENAYTKLVGREV